MTIIATLPIGARPIAALPLNNKTLLTHGIEANSSVGIPTYTFNHELEITGKDGVYSITEVGAPVFAITQARDFSTDGVYAASEVTSPYMVVFGNATDGYCHPVASIAHTKLTASVSSSGLSASVVAVQLKHETC